MLKKCIVCKKEFKIKPSNYDVIKTCRDKKCSFTLRSKISTRNRTGKHWDDNFKEAQSERIKLAYRQGKMTHMQKVWKDGKIKWAKEKNPRWKPIGSKRKSHGYTLIKVSEKKWQQEHRWIIEQQLGRKLKRKEIVHHINHNKSDNRIENLELMKDADHRRLHLKDNLQKYET